MTSRIFAAPTGQTYIVDVPRTNNSYDPGYDAELAELTEWARDQYDPRETKWIIRPTVTSSEQGAQWRADFSTYEAALAFYLRFG